LIAQKGRIPSWVLQAEVYPCLLIRDRRKFHIRTYIAAVENLDGDGEILDLYLYNRHEIRIASEPVSEREDGSRNRRSHITNGAGSASTERVLLDEVTELVERDMKNKVEAFVAKIFGVHFVEDMTRRVSYSASQDDASMDYVRKFAIAGLDIMVTEESRLYLLEVNVNPAAPPKETIKESFQDHLRGFFKDLIHLTLGEGAPNFLPVRDLLKVDG